MEKKVRTFLGGTCNNATWRDELIPLLTIDYFNPVVATWTEADQIREREERETCDYCLYLITPNMVGVYSIAEVADDSNKRPEKTVFAYLEHDTAGTFDAKMIKSLQATGDLVVRNGGMYIQNCGDKATIKKVAEVLNGERRIFHVHAGSMSSEDISALLKKFRGIGGPA